MPILAQSFEAVLVDELGKQKIIELSVLIDKLGKSRLEEILEEGIDRCESSVSGDCPLLIEG